MAALKSLSDNSKLCVILLLLATVDCLLFIQFEIFLVGVIFKLKYGLLGNRRVWIFHKSVLAGFPGYCSDRGRGRYHLITASWESSFFTDT